MEAAFHSAAETREGLDDVIYAAIEELVRQRYELPGFRTLQDAARRIRAEINHRYFQSVWSTLGEQHRHLIDDLLLAESGGRLAEGRSSLEAIELTLRQLEEPTNEDHEECASAIRQAVTLWRDRDLPPSPEVIERMGGGWVGEKALAISLYCALAAGEDFARGVLLAVNHSGDSDSTGAITGNNLGLMLGVEAIPAKWLAELELREEIEAVADDLYKRFEDTDAWCQRYPGW